MDLWNEYEALMVEASQEICVQLEGWDKASSRPPSGLGWFVWVISPPSPASPFPTLSPDCGVGWDWIEDTRKPTWVVCPSQCPWPQTTQRSECCRCSWDPTAFSREVGERKYKYTNWLNTIHEKTPMHHCRVFQALVRACNLMLLPSQSFSKSWYEKW